jgi:hypothetical protein
MTFCFLMSLAVIHLLLKPVKSVGLKDPSVWLSYLLTAARIFGILFLVYAIGVFFRQFLADFTDLLPFMMLLAALGLGKSFRLPEPLIILAYAAGHFLADQSLSQAFFHAVILCLGISGVEWLVDGMRFRLAFTPSSKHFSTLPGYLILLALIALVLSGFFTTLS